MSVTAQALTGELIGAEFFRRDPLRCARDLVGCELIWGRCGGVIVETEAYNAIGDEACHCFVRPSARAFVERNQAGAAYIYLNYGVHWMLNVLVKGTENGFVLIRALEPTRGIALMKSRRGVDEDKQLCSGPGKLTQALDITIRHHEINLCANDRFCFRKAADSVEVVADRRIGIRVSADLPWRFTSRDNRHVSIRPKVSGDLKD